VLFNVAAACRFASDSDINDLAAVRQGRRKLFYRSNVQESARAVLLSIANRLFLQQLVTGTSHKQLFIFVTWLDATLGYAWGMPLCMTEIPPECDGRSLLPIFSLSPMKFYPAIDLPIVFQKPCKRGPEIADLSDSGIRKTEESTA
jgi:hypothetical protein